MRLPATWNVFTRFLGLSKSQSHALWLSLDRATWSEAVTLCGWFLASEAMLGDHSPVAFRLPSAQEVMRCIELLIQERITTRLAATKVEEAILSRTRANGDWDKSYLVTLLKEAREKRAHPTNS